MYASTRALLLRDFRIIPINPKSKRAACISISYKLQDLPRSSGNTRKPDNVSYLSTTTTYLYVGLDKSIRKSTVLEAVNEA
jgi:hypothetical protein